MSLLPGRLRSRSDLLVAGAAVLVVLGLALAAPSQVGMLLAGLAIACVVGVVALSNPLLALLAVVLASFLRTAQKEIISAEALTPAFYAMLIALAIALAKRTRELPRLGFVEWMMTVYLVWNVVSALLPHQYDTTDPLTGQSVEVYRWIFSGVILPFVVYVVAKSVLDSEKAVRWFLWTVVGMTAYSAVIAFMQFHGPRRLVWPRFIITAPEWQGRAVGVFNQPVVNGILLVLGFMVCLFLATRPDTDRRVRWALYALTVLTAYATYLTHTRSALLSLVVALVMGAVFARGWRTPFLVYLGLGALAVVANAGTLFSSDRSEGGIGSSNEIYDRLNIIATGLKALGEHPFVGIGIARFRLYNTYEHVAWDQTVDWNRGFGIISHQNELGIAAELGIPGVLMWIGVLVGVLWLLWRALHELPDNELLGQPLAVLAATAMVVLIANGTTVDLRILDFAQLLPFLFAGMAVGQLDRHRERHSVGRRGLPGSGLPGGMSLRDQLAWDGARLGSRQTGPPSPPVGTPVQRVPDRAASGAR
jgi:O-antigen ligase